MGGAKRQWEEEQLERSESNLRSEIAKRLDLSSDELKEIYWEVTVDQSKEGLIYGYFINFDQDADLEILDRLGADDGTVYLEHSYADEDDYYEYQEELYWESLSEAHFKIFRNTADNINSLLLLKVPEESQFSLRVMLFMHAVSAMERVLQSTFLHEVSKSKVHTQRFVESDIELSKRPMVLGKFFKVQDNLKETVRNRIDEILFHNIRQIAGLYHNVFGLQLGNIKWLSNAVLKRHDCAHRAGYTRGGDRIELTEAEIKELLGACLDLTNVIEVHFRSAEVQLIFGPNLV